MKFARPICLLVYFAYLGIVGVSVDVCEDRADLIQRDAEAKSWFNHGGHGGRVCQSNWNERYVIL